MPQPRFVLCFAWLLLASSGCSGAEFTSTGDAGQSGTSAGSSGTSSGAATTTGSHGGASGSSAGGNPSSSTASTTGGSGGFGGLGTGGSNTGGAGGSGTGSGGSGTAGSATSGTGGRDAGSAGGSGGTGGTGGRDASSTGGSGGQPADASRSDAFVACDGGARATVKFLLTAPAGDDYCIDACMSLWLSVLPVGGGSPLAISGACTTTCAQCQPIACAPCAPAQHLKPEGEAYSWAGSVWERSTCGAQMNACVNQLCVPPGKYVARMCASRSTSDAGAYCMSSATPTCVEVPFEYPSATTVEGVLR